ncbi:unnamed protein product, partial [marine sediment metagenome]
YCKLRGGDIVATIYQDDMKVGSEIDFETAREQEVEFPKVLRVKYACAENDYTPSVEPSVRYSLQISALSELDVEVPVNFTPDDAAKTADIMHKIAWNEFSGRGTFSVGERFMALTPADLISVEVEPGEFKRMRLTSALMVDSYIDMEAVVDRASSYTSEAVSAGTVPIESPPGNLPGATTWEFMNLPALRSKDDTLHAYIAGFGLADAWRGANVQRQIDTEWIDEGAINFPETMGDNTSELPAHARGIDNTNSFQVSVSDGDINSVTQA